MGSRQNWHSSLSLMLLQMRAEAQLVLHVEDGLREMLGVVAAGAQHVERDALRGLLADAGQALEFGDQARQRFGEIGHRRR